ncbi:zinc finger MYM-type protein 1 [Trichonephila clavipes]|nr:zinc finger MYM-type protein 1 [Trichonephila clavipes]
MPREGAFHHFIIVSYPRQDRRSKGNGCAIQHVFMLLTVRYVSFSLMEQICILKKPGVKPDNIRVNETFLGFIEAVNQTAKSLESDVLNFLNTLDINLVKCRGQGYDGAASMSGAYGGLQKLIKDKQQRANYVHCSTHNLNLVLNDACNNVPHFEKERHRKVRQFFDDFNADDKLQDRKRLFEVDVFKDNVDVITTQLKNRFERFKDHGLSFIDDLHPITRSQLNSKSLEDKMGHLKAGSSTIQL